MTIIYTKQAQKDLKKLPRNVRLKIMNKVDALEVNRSSLSNNIKQLQGVDDVYSLRVGQYRVIYRDGGQILSITHIGVRGEIYRRLT